MFENMEVYGQIMDDVVARTNGDFSRMSFSDKLVTISIMKQVKEQVDKYMRESYPVVKAWASLDVKDITLKEQQPDLSRFKDDSFNEQFNKLMGNY